MNGETKTVHDISLDVWVIFLMDEIKLVKQIQTYPLWSFGAELGGYTGMFLGVSLMQVMQEICTCIIFIFIMNRYQILLQLGLKFYQKSIIV